MTVLDSHGAAVILTWTFLDNRAEADMKENKNGGVNWMRAMMVHSL